MLISGREARAELVRAGIPPHKARVAIESGLAGAPIKTSAAHLFDAERVRDLCSRRLIWPSEMRRRCPDGYFVSRRALDVGPDRRELLSLLLDGGYDGMSVWTRVSLNLGHLGGGGVPFVATVGGFVVLGADLVSVRRDRIELTDPGSWFDGLHGALLDTGRGRTWSYVRHRRLAG